MAPDSSRKRLPFEPRKSAAKPAEESKKAAAKPSAAKVAAQKSASAKKTAPAKPGVASKRKEKAKPTASAATAIPEVVSDRMLRRMLAFSGVPTGAGILTFFVSYYLVANQVVELPSYFVLLVTLGCFGLGVVGLTYGVLSASWDEDRPGTRLGLDEFRLNFGRMTSAWGAKSER
ncbi:PAM68 family protein [Leptolyngbya sp. CCNP1308]|uniref:PAM68 family protein n=1 Tax=Leptolyngbya sp. CCNP1308 TaxID=3110255 RepID=UPI002B214AB2|nr:PAM68 family protein [Leptolyngbya sp. CCNP1308]MEA5449906.1 PAM68 family protein [Leptolyngbya sp. CCNP1308]